MEADRRSRYGAGYTVKGGRTMDECGARRAQVPYCSGKDFPKNTIPAGACDCHHHIYDPVRFPYVPTDTRNQPPATADCYQLLKDKLGITRSVVVQPSAYGLDNRCTLDAVKQLGIQNTRAIVVLDNTVTDAELEAMHKAGARGIRFNMNCGYKGDWDQIRQLVERVAELGWCVCLWMDPDLLVEKQTFFEGLPAQLVLDHRGHLPVGVGTKHPAFDLICRWLDAGKAWVKLSGWYFDSAEEDYRDTLAVGRTYAKANPDRLLWGTDWPHPNRYSKFKPCPNDVALLDALMDLVRDEKTFHKTLVDNPEKLFGF